MLHHRTADPAERAWHIATREAMKASQETMDPGVFFTIISDVYKQTLEEMQPVFIESDVECNHI